MKNLTVNQLLNDDDKKYITEKILNEDIDDILLIYKDTKTHSIQYATTITDWTIVFGTLDIAGILLKEQFDIDSGSKN